jgi:predicted phage terminase large subunit-like protein
VATPNEIILGAKVTLCKKSYYHFFKEFWEEVSPETFTDNWHIKVLCDELQKMGERIKKRLPKEYDLVINVPPASTKSTIVTILYPVWLWTIDPTIKILSGSYGQSLALDHAVKSRNVIQSLKYRTYFPNIRIQEDSNNKASYENTQKGVRAATSVGSGIIGRHYHLHIVDDPLQANPTELDIQSANDWISTRLSTRKIDKEITPLILIMQRVHQKDCSAMIIAKGGRIKHINLPAELSPSTTVEYQGYYENGLFDNKRLPRTVLNQSKIELGTNQYSAQYQQSPVPEEGMILKKDWFSIKQFVLDEELEQLKKITWHLFIDSAYTDKTSNDASAILVAGMLNNTLVIRYSYQVWLEYPQLSEKIKEVAKIFGKSNSKIYIEPKASGKSIAQGLKNLTSLNVIELETTRDSKLTRVNAVSPIIESKRVVLVQDNWNKSFIEECTAFPNGTADDQLDTLVYAINKLIQTQTKLTYASA